MHKEAKTINTRTIRHGRSRAAGFAGNDNAIWVRAKYNHQGPAGFSLWFHLPGFHFGYAFFFFPIAISHK